MIRTRIRSRLNEIIETRSLTIDTVSQETGIPRSILTSMAKKDFWSVKNEYIEILFNYFDLDCLEDLLYIEHKNKGNVVRFNDLYPGAEFFYGNSKSTYLKIILVSKKINPKYRELLNLEYWVRFSVNKKGNPIEVKDLSFSEFRKICGPAYCYKPLIKKNQNKPLWESIPQNKRELNAKLKHSKREDVYRNDKRVHENTEIEERVKESMKYLLADSIAMDQDME